MFSCLQILEAFLWFVLIILLNVTLIILTLTLSLHDALPIYLRRGPAHDVWKVGPRAAGGPRGPPQRPRGIRHRDRKSTRLNSSHVKISYAVFCLKKKTCIQILEAFLCFVLITLLNVTLIILT